MGCKFFSISITLFLFVIQLSAQQTAVDSSAVQQKDLIDIVFKLFKAEKAQENREKRKVLFSIIPLASVSGGGRQVVVSSVNAAFYLGPSSTTNISTINFIPYTNFSDRLGFIITPNIWLDENKWNLTGEFRIANNIVNTYGLGANSSKDSLDEVNYQYIRMYVNANRKIVGPFYVGLGYKLDYFYNVKEISSTTDSSFFTKYGIGTGPQTTSTGITLNFLFDNRRNSINPSQGFYSSLFFRFNPKFLANDYEWSSIYFDTRKYFSLSERRHSILGIWALYWGTFGDVPFPNLPGTRLDLGQRSGRGYDLARYMGKQMLYGEIEYRFDISSDGLFGGTVFTNAQSYTEPESNRFEYLKPAAGVGLRIKFNKRSNTNVTLDFAFGKNSFNWYLNLGEFF
jgi:hypothetical protein